MPLFFRAVVDARRDPLFPCRNWAHAVVWTAWNWRLVRTFYRD